MFFHVLVRSLFVSHSILPILNPIPVFLRSKKAKRELEIPVSRHEVLIDKANYKNKLNAFPKVLYCIFEVLLHCNVVHPIINVRNMVLDLPFDRLRE